MMHGAHSAFGLLLGAAHLAAATHYDLMTPSPTQWFAGSLVAAGCALLPDIDHDKTMFTRSGGVFTRTIAEVFQFIARWVYRTTGGPTGRGQTGEHRGLLHSLLFAALAGLGIGIGSGHSPWFGFAALVLILAPGIRSLALELHHGNGIRVSRDMRTRLGAFLVAVTLAALLWTIEGDDLFGWWFGVMATIGMLAHLATDLPTNHGVPLLAPFTWRRFRLPVAIRFSVGTKKGEHIERFVARICLVASAGIMVCGITGFI